MRKFIYVNIRVLSRSFCKFALIRYSQEKSLNLSFKKIAEYENN